MAPRKKKVVETVRVLPGGARWIAHPNPLRLLTLDAEAVVWGAGGLPDVAGAIVRVIPPADTTDERIGAVLDAVRGGGAAATKLMPRETGQTTVMPVVARVVRRRHRDVVEEMVREVVGVDRDALALVVAEVMDEERL